MTQPIIFISYSRNDEKKKKDLLKHLGVLQSEGIISLWSDDLIGVGINWRQDISQAMAQARVAILLISADFLTSDFILEQELPALLQRRESEGLIIFPIIASSCAWKKVDWLQRMNIRPRSGKPIWGEGTNRVNKELTAIAEEVADIVRAGPPKVILFQDNFSSNARGWEEEDSLFIKGKLRRTLTTEGNGLFRTIPIPGLSEKDFFLSVEATIVEATGKAGVSIAFRSTEETANCYYVSFRNDGEYLIRLRQNKKNLKPFNRGMLGGVATFESGVVNTLGLLVKDTNFTVFVNNEEIAKVENTVLRERGQIKLGVETFEPGKVIVDFGNIIVKSV